MIQVQLPTMACGMYELLELQSCAQVECVACR